MPSQAIPTVYIVTDEKTGKYLYTEEVSLKGDSIKVGPHFFLKPEMAPGFHVEEVQGHEFLSGILTGFPPISSDAFCLNCRPIPLTLEGASWIQDEDPTQEWEDWFSRDPEQSFSQVLDVVSSELKVAKFSETGELRKVFFKSGKVIRTSLVDRTLALNEDPTVWILVHEDYNYPLFFRPDPSLTLGPYVFTHERAAVKAALDFPSDIVIARPGQTSSLLDELEEDPDFTDGIIFDPKMDEGFTLFEGIVPVTRAGAVFVDALGEEKFWGCLEEHALRRFAVDIMKKRTGMEAMD